MTTTRITHATPAAFYAHVASRYEEESVAAQLLESRSDVALGGGLGFFLPTAEQGLRRDGRDLVAEAERAGYTVWRRGTPRHGPPPERLLGLFAHDHLGYVLDEREYPAERRDPSLAELARLALAILGRDGQPFFLMIEGGRIDHAAHSFDAAGVVAETAAFDEAVAAALDFQRRRPRTLILLTADHATAGLAINDWVDWQGLLRQRASNQWLAAQIRDAGAGAELLADKTGYSGFTDADVAAIRAAPEIYEAARVIGRLLSERHGVTWIPRVNLLDTEGHTGEDIPLYAGGPGAQRFAGVLDNTDIPRRLVDVLGWEPLPN